MNCLTARQTLELGHPGESAAPKFDEAAQHVDGCPACRSAVRLQVEFDKKVGKLVRDIPVPEDLKERLLEGLDGLPTAAVAEAKDVVSRPALSLDSITVVDPNSAKAARFLGRSRRRWLRVISLAAAGCVVASLGTWSFWPKPKSVGLDSVIAQLANSEIDPALLPVFIEFYGGLAPKPPVTMETGWLTLPPRRLQNMDVAVYFFTFRGQDRKSHEGRLAVIPKRLVQPSDLPTMPSFGAGPPMYKGRFCVTAWVEGDFVYVCILSGNEWKTLAKQPVAI